MQLASPAFQDGTPLPLAYTCKGQGISPPLSIEGVPKGTQSLVLIMHDPDAIGGRDFLHWSLWNIPPGTATIPEGAVPDDAVQGMNDYPNATYGPACPPAGSGLHRYIFDLYALDITLHLPQGTKRAALENACNGHVLANARLVGVVSS